jgi:CheY-like chemotaxis protein
MRKRILITEDIADLRTVLKTFVESLGYECLMASNGREAVDMAAAELPDLIMMDMVMPGMDGLEATRLIRQNPKTSSIPILAVTGLGTDKHRNDCLQSGCDDYIAKPFKFAQLIPRIEKLLKSSEKQHTA